ncbi:sterol uptake control protein 2 [Podospora conica]|nr:sterol uptake control protein 2 [Schizothecium conicum]
MGSVFAHTFLILGGEGPSLRVVAPEETMQRKKRPHRCDEGDPCGNCVKRCERCVRTPPLSISRTSDDSPSPTSMPREMDWSPAVVPASEGVPVNLLHMELLHHFERFTMPTLCWQEVWPTMLQMAFRFQQHTFLVNAMLSLAAAHLTYLVPDEPRYQHAKDYLFGRALRDYREALSAPITADNCDPLLGGAVLVHYLLWYNLNFMDGQAEGSSQPLDLSGDRLYWLSTGQRQIFFMSWPLFQSTNSIFMRVGILQPCMSLSDEVDARGLNWRRLSRPFMDLYDDPRFQGGRGETLRPGTSASADTASSPMMSSPAMSPISSRACSVPVEEDETFAYRSTDMLKVLILWESYKEGEDFVKAGGVRNEMLTRRAFRRLADRLAIAMAYVEDGGFERQCPATDKGGRHGSMFRREHVMRYVLTFPMLCFGPLLSLISSGDSRALVLLYHVYHVVDTMLQSDEYWWCRKRVTIMLKAIKDELDARGLRICVRSRDRFL